MVGSTGMMDPVMRWRLTKRCLPGKHTCISIITPFHAHASQSKPRHDDSKKSHDQMLSRTAFSHYVMPRLLFNFLQGLARLFCAARILFQNLARLFVHPAAVQFLWTQEEMRQRSFSLSGVLPVLLPPLLLHPGRLLLVLLDRPVLALEVCTTKEPQAFLLLSSQKYVDV